MRTGVIAKKVGMTRYFTDTGVQVPVSVLKIDNCQVVGVRTQDTDGYVALQLGAGARKAKNVSKSVRGNFAKAKVEPKAKMTEFRVSPEGVMDMGAEITADHFLKGQYVDVTGTSKGKGFAGGMKRWGFKGLRATHGVSVSHRSHGSTGQCQDPGKVFKNKKMAGHMGDRTVTKQNLEIVAIDTDENVLLVKGAIPGGNGGWVYVSDAIKKHNQKDLPYPTVEKKQESKAADNVEQNAQSNESASDDTVAATDKNE